MKQIIIGLLVVVGLGFLFWGGKTSSSQKPITPVTENSAGGALVLSEKNFDFGSISMKKGKVSRAFSLENSADTPLVIKTVSTSCMCTEAFIKDGETKKGPFGMPGHGFVPPANITLPANSKTELEVVFDPAAHGPAGVGRIERAVFIEDGNGESSTIVIKAMVTP